MELYKCTGLTISDLDREVVEIMSGKKYVHKFEEALFISSKLVTLTCLMKISRNRNIDNM